MSTRNGEPPLFLSETQREILRKSALCAALTADQCEYFFEVIERTRLDPFTGQIRADVRNKKNEDGSKTPTLLLITTLQGLRVIGDRTGQLDGESAPEWCDAEGNWKEVWLGEEPPAAARASIFRKDRPRPQISIVRWDAFVQKTYNKQGQEVPNKFWQKMGSHMLAKCSIAGGYRGAFPNQCSGLYISEEIGAILDPDSEEAIEAEMVRKAREEQERTEKAREAGELDITALQRAQGIYTRDHERTDALAAAERTMPMTTTAPAPPLVPAQPTALGRPISDSPSPEWENFVITRIKLFEGRSVGSLTPTEMAGVRPFVDRLRESYASLDKDLQAHYRALKGRMDHDIQEELDQLSAGVVQ